MYVRSTDLFLEFERTNDGMEIAWASPCHYRGGLKQITQLELGFDMSLWHAETNAAAENRGLKCESELWVRESWG